MFLKMLFFKRLVVMGLDETPVKVEVGWLSGQANWMNEQTDKMFPSK